MSTMSEREKRNRRHLRLRKKVVGTAVRPRLLVNRSLHHVHAQLIDDMAGRTLVSASSVEPTLRAGLQGLGTGNQNAAAKIGEILAQRALEKSIKHVVFDRGGNRYHGRVKVFADAARKAGLEF